MTASCLGADADLRPDDQRLMGLAIALGRRHLGLTWPNPSVGAVVVAPGDGPIVATGVTQPGGRPHGEPMALAAAGASARGATLYVSLEPCSHHGRSPPCTDAIIASGVARVVSAIEDPDSRVAGTGHRRLREAGILTSVGVLADDAHQAHIGHFTRITQGRPAVQLKLAQTADGYAGRLGERVMITGERANARTQLARARADAIMVGISTVAADDPRLDVRLPGLEDRSPVRVVLDSRLRVSELSRVVHGAGTRPTWVVCTEAANREAEKALQDLGVDVIRAPLDPQGRVDLLCALRLLGERGITRVFCEGGPTVADALAGQNLLDEVVLMTNSRPLGAAGIPAIGPRLQTALRNRLGVISDEIAGEDRIQVYGRASCSPGS